MKEIELKFQVPDSALSGVHEALKALGQAPAITMHAAYFDTSDHALARQRCAWRVRREGDDWVQTYKGLGADAMTRVEENCALQAPADGRPAPLLSAHSPEVQRALRRALGAAEAGQEAPLPPLLTVYDTRFERHVRTLDHALGRVAVCLDLGAIVAGSAHERLQELEFELLDGQPQALLSLAMGWVQAHGLWLDVQSKAMKGTRLAAQVQAQAQAPSSAGQRACQPVPLPAVVQTPRAHLSALLDTCAGNWAELAMPREGWADALALWRQAHPMVSQAMAGTPLGDSPQWRALDTALQSALTEPDSAERAAELATSAAPTGWALAVLSHLQTLS